ncbi:Uncharacterized protein OBRU01_00087 [Operophtera brumata]|uniref:THAP-type domain-containing protein n=1 Tax=Operophtera brumata TaxID=104452 RepID=A0A0L7LTF3_OPEBR|nr:Uncharacterized protein OBRU01_00087 [Operophtera brumata]
MGYYCTVPQCTSLAGKTKNVKFHRFPRDTSMADKWNIILKRGKPYTKYSKVCSLHFTQADYNMDCPELTSRALCFCTPKCRTRNTKLFAISHSSTNYAQYSIVNRLHKVYNEEFNLYDIFHNSKETFKREILKILEDDHAFDGDPKESHRQVPRWQERRELAYRLQTLGHMANNISPQHSLPHTIKPKKQDAIMQTDPVQNEDDDTQPNNSYSEVSEKSYSSEVEQYETYQNQKEPYKPKDYTKSSEDYIPQTNEEYNKEAEKYALERKSHTNGYDLKEIYQKQLLENGYPKIPDVYYDKTYPRDSNPYLYQNSYPDRCNNVMQPQGSPYYPPTSHNNMPGNHTNIILYVIFHLFNNL